MEKVKVRQAPESVDEARKEYNDLLRRHDLISRDLDSARGTEEDSREWRTKALIARDIGERRIRLLEGWLRKHGGGVRSAESIARLREPLTGNAQLETDFDLLRSAYKIIYNIEDLDPEERRVLAVLEYRLGIK